MFRKILNFIRHKLQRKPEFYYCSIGDICSKKLIEKGFRPRVIVIDGKTSRRKRVYFTYPKHYKMRGLIFRGFYDEHLLRRLHRIVRESRSKPVLLCIEGEEDLLYWGILIWLRLGDKIKVGKEIMVVNEKLKKEAHRQIQKRMHTHIPSIEEYKKMVLEKLGNKPHKPRYTVSLKNLYKFDPQPIKKAYRVVETPERIKGSGIVKERLQTGSFSKLYDPQIYREEVEKRLKRL